MNTGIIAKRYAKALYAFAQERNEAGRLYEEMKSLSESFLRAGDFRSLLSDPILDRSGKLKLLQSAVGGKPSPAYVRFIKLVLDHKRENLLQPMALAYIDICRKENHIVTGSLITAVPIPAEVENAMRAKLLSGREGTLEFSLRVDPAILGGFVFDYDTYRLDASLASQLRKVKNQLLEKNKKTV